MNAADLEILAKLWGYESVRDPRFIEIIASQIILDGLEKLQEAKKEN
jgi:hypothetical protein